MEELLSLKSCLWKKQNKKRIWKMPQKSHSPPVKGKHPGGRPTKYSPELAEEICEVIASTTSGLAKLCSERSHWPEPANIFIWLRKYPDFRDQYALAKEDQVEASVGSMQEVMDEPHKYHDEYGNERIDVSMLRVKHDAIKWQAGKLKPKKYGGDKELQNERDKNDELRAELLKLRAELDANNKREY